jgi:hypothetical protein
MDDEAFAAYLRRPAYRVRPSVAGDTSYTSGAILEVNATDPPAPIWTNGFHVPRDRIPEIISLLEAAYGKANYPATPPDPTPTGRT